MNKLKGVVNISDTMNMVELENNIKSFLDWGLLNIGAFTNVTIPTTTKDGPLHQLIKNDKNPLEYYSIRKDWVYEDIGLPVKIYIDGVDYGKDNPVYSYTINYPEGRVVFKSLPQNPKIEAEYSFRNIQIYRESQCPWFKLVQYSTYDYQKAVTVEKGNYTINSKYRIQPPCIVVGCVPSGGSSPYSIGSGSIIRHQEVDFLVIAEDPQTRNNITDILLNQYDKTIFLYGSDEVGREGKTPLTYLGDINPDGLTYVDMVKNYTARSERATFTNTRSTEINALHPDLFTSVVTSTIDIVIKIDAPKCDELGV